MLTTLIATEPATPTFSPEAPEVALARKLLVPSAPPTPLPAGSLASSLITAESVSDCASTVAPVPIRASVTDVATFNPTATPTPKVAVASPVPVALPSATAEASVSLLALSVSAPPESTVNPSGIDAVALEAAMFTATAPATLSERPLSLLVLSVAEEASSSPVSPPFDSPSSRLEAISSSTVGPSLLGSASPSSPSPPAALAFACAELSEAESATNITEPPAVIARAVVASAVSLTTFTAIDSPIPAFAPTASPLVSVVVVPRCVAVALNAPPSTNALGSFPMNAWVVLFATLTPTAPPTATPSVDVAPVCASVSIACVPLALSVRAFRSADATLPASTTPLPSKAPMAARVSLSATFTATDAPTPRLPPFAPPSFGSAFAVLALVFAASNDTSPVPPATN